jgi:hypothetical protein
MIDYEFMMIKSVLIWWDREYMVQVIFFFGNNFKSWIKCNKWMRFGVKLNMTL